MEKPLEVGDAVTLKSGGQVMTVAALMGDGDASVVWFRDGKMDEVMLPLNILRRHIEVVNLGGVRPGTMTMVDVPEGNDVRWEVVLLAVAVVVAGFVIGSVL